MHFFPHPMFKKCDSTVAAFANILTGLPQNSQMALEQSASLPATYPATRSSFISSQVSTAFMKRSSSMYALFIFTDGTPISSMSNSDIRMLRQCRCHATIFMKALRSIRINYFWRTEGISEPPLLLSYRSTAISVITSAVSTDSVAVKSTSHFLPYFGNVLIGFKTQRQIPALYWRAWASDKTKIASNFSFCLDDFLQWILFLSSGPSRHVAIPVNQSCNRRFVRQN